MLVCGCNVHGIEWRWMYLGIEHVWLMYLRMEIEWLNEILESITYVWNRLVSLIVRLIGYGEMVWFNGRV